ncbi:hypothetical protein Purlil1_6586 [Purpureocillium lilacinum]|uniref:Uncharacterized protein n=1 Tax=Purpureocillium lilacinum TaxID=33203 RepID=A0ABR0BZS8_PURLI|nr:hypothetical protein Purlil1_6586 [Purpureocillium lilacinum]
MLPLSSAPPPRTGEGTPAGTSVAKDLEPSTGRAPRRARPSWHVCRCNGTVTARPKTNSVLSNEDDAGVLKLPRGAVGNRTEVGNRRDGRGAPFGGPLTAPSLVRKAQCRRSTVCRWSILYVEYCRTGCRMASYMADASKIPQRMQFNAVLGKYLSTRVRALPYAPPLRSVDTALGRLQFRVIREAVCTLRGRQSLDSARPLKRDLAAEPGAEPVAAQRNTRRIDGAGRWVRPEQRRPVSYRGCNAMQVTSVLRIGERTAKQYSRGKQDERRQTSRAAACATSNHNTQHDMTRHRHDTRRDREPGIQGPQAPKARHRKFLSMQQQQQARAGLGRRLRAIRSPASDVMEG